MPGSRRSPDGPEPGPAGGELVEPDPALLAVLGRAQTLGFIGPGPIGPHIDHAERFAAAWGASGPASTLPARALDLGSGGGLPGLALACRWPSTSWKLVDANDRRTAFLREAIVELGVGARVEVIRGRAEVLAHDAALRGSVDLVTARSFGPPAVTAECASGFLAVDGRLVVSEPPGGSDRWDPGPLAGLGLEVAGRVSGCQVLIQRSPCPDRYPRRVGIPAKRPLF